MADLAPSDREALARAFLAQAGWGDVRRRHLAGDASDRSYQRLQRGTETAVLMDAPPGRGDDPADFVAIAAHLRGLGLSPPAVLAEDLGHGFLLLEDLGDALFARLLMASEPVPAEAELYAAATNVLVHLQRSPAPAGLPDLAAQDWAEAAAFAPDWYALAATGERPDTMRFKALLAEALARHADGPRVLILRDYHAENLLWLPGRRGVARVGLLDFQLAQMGQPGYDLVSLLQDARRDVPEEMERAMMARFVAATAADPEAFAASYAVLGAQRALRILGIFARLCLVAGKPGYVALIPRVWGQLWRNLRHPALAPLAEECRALLPEPALAVLERIRAQCGRMR
ncbi:aminoglycoside phosphotransferase family protein [Rhodobacter sp. NSM]|uniref:aminoglycoside phosphotransferase family protein n=1 Tax=Rhodobacter sp. NSM TaxID=3457501 RepID=UPI003FD12ADD